MNSSILEFQNFDLDSPSKEDSTRIDLNPQKSQSYLSDRSSPDISEKEPSKYSNKSFWTFEYYQQFFDVNTDEVQSRIIWSMVPRSNKNYLENYIQPNPDLYGPLWICTTLIFTIAVSGNVANYLQYAPEGNYHWRYDFHLVSYAASAILSYACLVPVALWFILKWNNSEVTLSFLELLCAYGYSLSIYVPVSVLSVIQVSWFQWGITLIAASASAAVLVSSIKSSARGAKRFPVLALVVSLHFLLAVGFMLYFFHVPDISEASGTVTVAPLAPSLNATAVKTNINITEKPHTI